MALRLLFLVVEVLPLWRARRVMLRSSMWPVEASESEAEEISITFSSSLSSSAGSASPSESAQGWSVLQ